ncbi:MAG: Glycosyltransferase Gtf1 [Bacteroidetes bacterium ADurb.Bin408]|nr:MAG: Glycosyltransferase Gtf1 [Bacteroidetes bacterium ADurb.Bin408]
MKWRLPVWHRRYRLQKILQGVDVVFSNTITNGALLREIKPGFRGRIISYVHELDMACRFFSTPRDLETTLELTDHFFVPCEAVKTFLVNRKKVPAHKVSLLHYYIPALPVVPQEQLHRFCELSGIIEDFVVGAIGTVDWRKGIDVFISVAIRVFHKIPGAGIQFVWMGAEEGKDEVIKALSDLEKAGLGDRVVLLPQSGANYQFFNSIDMLLLSSREDPYPLVVLEAASAGVPTICFDKAGGAPEFVGDQCGTVVPYLNIEAMTDGVVNYYRDRDIMLSHSDAALKKVNTKHQSKDLILCQIIPLIN